MPHMSEFRYPQPAVNTACRCATVKSGSLAENDAAPGLERGIGKEQESVDKRGDSDDGDNAGENFENG